MALFLLFHCTGPLNLPCFFPTFGSRPLQIVTIHCWKPLWCKNHKSEANKYFYNAFMNVAVRQPVTKPYRRVGGNLTFMLNWQEFSLKGICLVIHRTVAIMCQFSPSVVCNWDEGSTSTVHLSHQVSLPFQLSSNAYVCCARVWSIWHMTGNAGEG